MSFRKTKVMLLPSETFFALGLVAQTKIVRSVFENMGLRVAKQVVKDLVSGVYNFDAWVRDTDEGKEVSLERGGWNASIMRFITPLEAYLWDDLVKDDRPYCEACDWMPGSKTTYIRDIASWQVQRLLDSVEHKVVKATEDNFYFEGNGWHGNYCALDEVFTIRHHK